MNFKRTQMKSIKQILKKTYLLIVWSVYTIDQHNFYRMPLMQMYLPATRQHEGVGSLPGGLEYYESCLQWHLASDLPPRTLHNIALQTVQELLFKMDDVSALWSSSFLLHVKTFNMFCLLKT